MEKNGWKILAIVFIALFVLETGYLAWSVSYVLSEQDKTNECYYDICGEYDDAFYEASVCYCYNADMLGELQVAKTEVMK